MRWALTEPSAEAGKRGPARDVWPAASAGKQCPRDTATTMHARAVYGCFHVNYWLA